MNAIHPAVQHFVLLLFTAAFSAVGWFIAHNSSKAYRFFTFGLMPVPEQGFYIGFLRLMGWCSAVFTTLSESEKTALVHQNCAKETGFTLSYPPGALTG